MIKIKKILILYNDNSTHSIFHFETSKRRFELNKWGITQITIFQWTEWVKSSKIWNQCFKLVQNKFLIIPC